MNHSFTPSQIDSNKCARCSFAAIDHGSRATCEACSNTGECEIVYGNMLLCKECQEKEKIAQEELKKPENQARRIMEHNQRVNEQIQARSDVFNAPTVPIVEMLQAIDNNPEITNKLVAKAEYLKGQIQHFDKVIFSHRSELEKAVNTRSMIHENLNNVANRLRADEREKLKLADLSYTVEKPKSIKSTSGAKASKASGAKLSEIREAAAEYKVPIDAVAMICRARNMSAKDAAFMLAKQIHGDTKVG